MNLLQVLLNPEREERESGERTLVCEAANVLQVAEFQVLQLAYHDWFGGDLPEAASTHLFGRYMLSGEVPPWARHFARSVLARAECGRIDAESFHPATALSPRLRPFCLAAGFIVLTLTAAIWAAGRVSTQPASRLPPYFERSELPRGTEAPDAAAGAH